MQHNPEAVGIPLETVSPSEVSSLQLVLDRGYYPVFLLFGRQMDWGTPRQPRLQLKVGLEGAAVMEMEGNPNSSLPESWPP